MTPRRYPRVVRVAQPERYGGPCRGWQARLHHKTPRGSTKFFADRQHGGSDAARARAEQWLKEQTHVGTV